MRSCTYKGKHPHIKKRNGKIKELRYAPNDIKTKSFNDLKKNIWVKNLMWLDI